MVNALLRQGSSLAIIDGTSQGRRASHDDAPCMCREGIHHRLNASTGADQTTAQAMPEAQPSASSNCRSSPLAPARCRLSRRYRKHIAYTLRSSPRSRASGVRSAPSCLFPALSWVISSNETMPLFPLERAVFICLGTCQKHIRLLRWRYDPPPSYQWGRWCDIRVRA